MESSMQAVPGPEEAPQRREAPGKQGEARACPGRAGEPRFLAPDRATGEKK